MHIVTQRLALKMCYSLIIYNAIFSCILFYYSKTKGGEMLNLSDQQNISEVGTSCWVH